MQRWKKALLGGGAVFGLAVGGGASAAQVAGFSFTGQPDGAAGPFADEAGAVGVDVGDLTGVAMSPVGVVSGFIGADDQKGYGPGDSDMYAVTANVTVNASNPGPNDNYFEFTIRAQAGYQLTLESLSIDFGIDTDLDNINLTKAHYDLYADINGGGFSSAGISSPSGSGLVGNNDGDAYGMRDDVDKSLIASAASPFTTGVANDARVFTEADTIIFRLAFGDTNSGSVDKRIVIDDIKLFGEAVLIPEPSTIGLVIAGAALLIARRR